MPGPNGLETRAGDTARPPTLFGRLTLYGRAPECEALGQLIANVQAGRSRVLVVRGQDGIGKTALLDHLETRGSECQIVRLDGIESEATCAFAALHRLCVALHGRPEQLPAPQRNALESAFGLRDCAAPDGFLTGMAVLGLLADACVGRPLICVIDDAQWLDSESAHALGLAARRLKALPAALVIAVREPSGGRDFAGIPDLPLEPLHDQDARALLDARLFGPMDPAVRDRVLAEARGNPRRLLASAGRQTAEELGGGFGLPSLEAASAPEAGGLLRALDALPRAVRRLLLIAAAEPTGSPALVWRAADLLDVARGPQTAAAGAIADFGAFIRFRHVVGRSVAYWSASSGERREVHAALAAGIDPDADAWSHAWHRALASPAPDESVAAAIERSANGVRSRGGLQADAIFRDHAVELTPGSEHRARRALAAARVKHLSGAAESASRLLAIARAGPLDEPGHRRADMLEARLASQESYARGATRLTLAARHLETVDPALAREGYRDALHAVLVAGRLAGEEGLRGVAAAVLARRRTLDPPICADLVDAMAFLIARGPAAGAPQVRQALKVMTDAIGVTEVSRGELLLGCRAARDLWDHATWSKLSEQLIEQARRAGALRVLPVALHDAVVARVVAGDFVGAAKKAGQAEAAVKASGAPVGPYGTLALAAWSGAHEEVERLTSAATAGLLERDEGRWISAAGWAAAVVGNSMGRYRTALTAAQRGAADPLGLGFAAWSTAELVEAAVRAGHPETVDAALGRLGEVAEGGGTDWSRGILARAQALASGEPAAEGRYREAIALLDRAALPAEAARARLLYGEWLRRRKRRTDARKQLRASYRALAEMGAAGFAARARRELAATGETIRHHVSGHGVALTTQEARIARLAADGLTNHEIGARLFLSARTVEWHLHKAYEKLRVRSRRELHGVL